MATLQQKIRRMKKNLLLFFSIITVACASGQAGNKKQPAAVQPFVLGSIVQIESKELNEIRPLNIYLPEGYQQSDTTKYPVIYLLDGSANEDFIHIVGLVQFNSFEWVKQIPKSIVVGIATVDRKRDFTFPTSVEQDRKAYPTTGHSAQFIQFIEKELQPFIENKYHVNTSKTIIGQSLGGLLLTEILFSKPTLFNTYIVVSPSVWWNDGSILDQSIEPLLNNQNQQTSIYIGVGKEGLTPTTMPRVMEVDANLLFEKIKQVQNKNVHVYFDYLPQENHATILHQAVANAFRLLHPKN